MLEDLEAEEIEYESVEEFLAGLKKEFGGGDEKATKMAELKRIERGRIMKEFMQKFRRIARKSKYKRRPLIEEFKRRMSEVIRKKLMKAERPPTSIEQ